MNLKRLLCRWFGHNHVEIIYGDNPPIRTLVCWRCKKVIEPARSVLGEPPQEKPS